MLPVAALPDVDFPTITVSAALPGASPDTMATTIATPLEQQFAAIPGLVAMTSWSGLGNTSITLQFALDRSIDGAATDVQTAINSAGGLLPRDMPTPPIYRKVNAADQPVLIYAVHSDDMPLYKIDDYAYTVLAQKISAISGVGAGDDRRPAGLRRPHPRRSRAHSPRTASAWRTSARASPRPRSTRPRARSRASRRPSSSTPTTSSSRRRATAT